MIHNDGVSLGIASKVPEGIVLAADSRITLYNTVKGLNGADISVASVFDHHSKLLPVRGQEFVGIITFGLGAFGTAAEFRTAQGFMPEFETTLGKERLSVKDCATKLSEFFKKEYERLTDGQPYLDDIYFIVGGYDEDSPYGKLFRFSIPSAPNPVESTGFGPIWGGDTGVVNRILNGIDGAGIEFLKARFNLDDAATIALTTDLTSSCSLPVPTYFTSLQDSINMCVGLIRTTIAVQSWTTGQRTVGGMCDVATITRTEGFKFVQHKEVTGEKL